MSLRIVSDGHPSLTRYSDDAGLFSSAMALSLNALSAILRILDP
jgi:hypothetical protein